ncbi:MAG: AmmeMemoRadiSam system protein B [Deltaproteobacteria bacterium]|nr:AmmeMemoRadiSam system protein B [Candidatus Tharpella sp.]
MDSGILRQPAVAGTFYGDDPVALRCEIEAYLTQAKAPLREDTAPIALVVPHAGYYFSGGVAATAYQLVVELEFDLVVVVAPTHHHAFAGISIYNAGNYLTPLGEVKVERELAADLIGRYQEINFVPEAHQFEHSLEVQLPFLQVALGDFTLLPLIMGRQGWSEALRLAEILAQLAVGRRLLLIASSDLSHFHNAVKAQQLDQQIVKAVAAFDPAAFWSLIENHRAEACGAGPLLSVMQAAQKIGADHAQILSYRHSGEICGDNSRVVGYLSAAFYGTKFLEGI